MKPHLDEHSIERPGRLPEGLDTGYVGECVLLALHFLYKYVYMALYAACASNAYDSIRIQGESPEATARRNTWTLSIACFDHVR